ncbi:hypothetical protein [Streptomyces erythrochromogenes]|uniref:hypothetical protein n=1 Tax=Streptomyces erythrochromogenes TaxID=285574 RepID=UPI0022545A39|nr:hypothetical protein [Streptomyces erythrochromogenes]MCX5584262.1 hypothetical protein [Streptomyces erythrochromogenes]
MAPRASRRQAERQARSAQHLGERRRAADAEGPLTVLPVAVDQLRAAIAKLPESQRPAAAERAVQLLDGLRQDIAES